MTPGQLLAEQYLVRREKLKRRDDLDLEYWKREIKAEAMVRSWGKEPVADPLPPPPDPLERLRWPQWR